MTAIQAAERQAAQQNLVHEMAAALAGCIEHLEWSTQQGAQAFQSAIDALAKAGGEKS